VQRPGSSGGFHAVYDSLGTEAQGFGYTCSDDGLHWESGVVVSTPTGCRTPFGLIELTPAEVTRMTPAILAYGTINATQLAAPNSSLQWSFYTHNDASGYEVFRASITYLAF
jgi:hypothetical protein